MGNKFTSCLLLAALFFLIPCFTGQVNAQQVHASDIPDDDSLDAYLEISAEDSIIMDFPEGIKDIKNHLMPTLGATERQILKKCKTRLDTSYFGLGLNSNSDSHEITYNWGILKTIVRDQIAYEIANNTGSIMGEEEDAFVQLTQVEYNRSNFYTYYNKFLTKLSDSINPRAQAELTYEQLVSLTSRETAVDFRWTCQRRIIHTYLHEFYHQVQGYSKQYQQLTSRHLSSVVRDSLLRKLEIDCDRFVYFQCMKLHLNPINYVTMLHLMGVFKESRLNTEVDIMERKLKTLELILKRCSRDYHGQIDSNAIKREIFLEKNDINNEKIDYELAHKRYAKKDEEAVDKNPYSLITIGDLFLAGSNVVVISIDSALRYYTLAANADTTKPPLAGIRDKRNFRLAIEKGQLYSGKIFEMIKKDNVTALKYFEMAREYSHFMERSYYNNLITRVSRHQTLIKNKADKL